jgi:serine/threonine-protein kinase
MSWGAGTLILNRYRLESLLGRGGMGSVWRAEHVQLKSPVAVKLLDPSIATNEQVLARFLREAQAAAALRSPHVVQIFDYGVEEGTAFIAMEMLHGQSLSDRIAAIGKLSPDDTFRFLQQVLRAIAKAHEAGIVHRDLKPDNIFICQDDPEFAKVLDFGVAKVKSGDLAGSAGSRTQTGMMIGTPYYMSPEQTQAKDIDPRADLWAIAVIAFECLTGRRPFLGDSFGELVIHINTKPVPIPSQVGVVPAGFDEWFVKGTQRDRDRRFQSAKEMADELARLGGPAGAVSRAAVPRSQLTPAVTPAVTPAALSPGPPQKDLQLTTGARSVTSQSVGSSAGRSPLVLALAGIGALIVLGAGAFVALGGPRALMQGEEAAAASAAEPTPPVGATLPPPEQAAPAASPVPSPAPSAVPSTASAPAVDASKKASEPEKRKPERTSDAPAKKTAPPKPAAPTGPAPPKDWNF